MNELLLILQEVRLLNARLNQQLGKKPDLDWYKDLEIRDVRGRIMEELEHFRQNIVLLPPEPAGYCSQCGRKL